jgi:hypothetical protein
VGESFLSTLRSSAELRLSSISNNIVIFSVTLAVLVLTLLGMAWFVRVDLMEMRVVEKKAMRVGYRFSTFLELATPIEFNEKPWYIRLIRKVRDLLLILSDDSFRSCSNVVSVRWSMNTIGFAFYPRQELMESTGTPCFM